MTDLEMTKLCAEAMEIDCTLGGGPKAVWIGFRSQCEEYDPLHDDAQAMALVKKFKLIIARRHIITDDNSVTVFRGDDLNRAIVECVAKMQKEKP